MTYESPARAIFEELQKLADLLEANNYRMQSLSDALRSEDDSNKWHFLTSNSLWGGAGSVADQALLDIPDARDELENILIRIGREQKALGKVNERTDMWLSFFESRR